MRPTGLWKEQSVQDLFSTRRYVRFVLAVLALLGGAYQAHGTDVFTAPNMLKVATMRIGNATYSNVVLTIHSIVSPPSGKSPNGTWDTYSPTNRQLTVPAVQVGKRTYFNEVVAVARLTSIGSVIGADTFDGTNLTIPYMLVGATPYYNVVLPVSLANIGDIHGGLPRVTWDQYDASVRKFTIPTIQFGDKIYTNVILHVGLSKFDFIGITASVLHSFGSAGDGAMPFDSLIQASDGSFYGMTSAGGENGTGAVIKITPAGIESVLYSFGAAASGDGSSPYGSLVQADDGNLYGMTFGGGANGMGTVIKISTSGTESVLYSFGSYQSGDGYGPYGSLIQASDGNFYGMTPVGGANGTGAVIKITPEGSELVLYSLGSAGDGANPNGSLIQASDGNFYGMTYRGGANGFGTVIKITPAGTESVLHSFGSASDGANPNGSLIQASDGNFYGMTSVGGMNGGGAVIKITPAGTESVLHSFGSAGDGYYPSGSLFQASDENFYGMTHSGGAIDPFGAVIKITPGGTESVLYSFGSAGDGYGPDGSLIQASNGNLYGMTLGGGENTCGRFSCGALIEIKW